VTPRHASVGLPDDLVGIGEDSTEDFMSLTKRREIESSDQILALLRSVY
jgi:hypothetical protein